MKMIKRNIKFLFTTCLLVLFLCVPSQATETNSSETTFVELFFFDYECDVSIPENLLQSYQIPVEEGMEGTYAVVSGNSATVSETGLITPRIEYTYWVGNIGFSYSTGAENEVVTTSYVTGTTVISATVNGEVTEYTVNVTDYADIYVNNHIADISATIKSAYATQSEQFEAAVAYVAENYDYSASYAHYYSMIMHGAGDCWASVSYVLALCKELGITAYGRDVIKSSGIQSGHRDVVALCDGTIYIGDAGYVGTKPRHYSCNANPSGFSGVSTVYQYNGFVEDVVVPEGVVTIGNGSESIFGSSYRNVKSVTLSSTVSEIATFALYGKSITEYKVDEDNPYFTSVDGVLYSKDMKTIVAYPAGKATDTFTIPDTVTTIGKTCFYYASRIEKVVIPETVSAIEEGAFFYSELECLTIPSSVKTIGTKAFYNIDELFVKTADASIDAPLCFSNISIYCLEDSTFLEYAKTYSIQYYICTLEELENVGIDLSNAIVQDVEDSYACVAGGVKPVPTVVLEGVVLEEGKEYTISYSGYNSAGTATMTIKGVGRYKGSVTHTYEVTKIQVVNPVITYKSDEILTTKNVNTWFTDVLSITFDGKELVYEEDFEISDFYIDFFDDGSGKYVKILFTGPYKGAMYLYNINCKKCKETPKQDYTGEELTPEIVIPGLKENEDYVIDYENNVEVGTAKAIIQGKGFYFGTMETTFEIGVLGDISTAVVTGVDESYYFCNESICPEPIVTWNGSVLQKNVDYTVAYDSNYYPGTAELTINGIGDYKGTIAMTYDIVQIEVINPIVTISEEGKNVICTKDNINDWIRQYVTVIYDGKELEYGTDYRTSTKSYDSTGKTKYFSIVFQGLYKYDGYIRITLISKDVTDNTENTNNGDAVTDDTTEVDDLDFPDDVDENTSDSVTVDDKDALTYTVEKTTVSKVRKLKVKAKKTSLSISWQKLSGVSGYQLQVSTKKNFKGAKNINISKKKTTYTKKGLKKNKKYYVRIRAYKKYIDTHDEIVKVYGSWSKITKKTKK